MITYEKIAEKEDDFRTKRYGDGDYTHRKSVRIPEHLQLFCQDKEHTWFSKFVNSKLQEELEKDPEYIKVYNALLARKKAELKAKDKEAKK